MRYATVYLALGICLLACSPASAQSESTAKPGASAKKQPGKNDTPKGEKGEKPERTKNGKNKPLPGVTPEREAAVMAFVKQHHEALAELLVQLKNGSPQEYEKAIRDLYRTSERLAQIQERDPALYELELKLWQAQSRVQLLSARIKMSENRDLREQLQAALGEQLDMRLAILRHERERLSNRVSDLDQQLQKLENGRQQLIDRQVKTLVGGEKSTPVKTPAKSKDK